jgi:methionine synthase II (cobalamin-independent)
VPRLPALSAFHAGSVPWTDPAHACRLVRQYFPAVSGWPQLPRRTFSENMYAQFSERFPGIVLEADRIWVDRRIDLDPELEALYMAYLEDDLAYGELSADYALGLPTFLAGAATVGGRPVAIKGQVTGPVSWGLTVVDQDRRPTLYDEILADAIAKHLRLKARWQERTLRAICPPGVETIISVDEPFMSSFGSAFVALGREQVLTLIDEVLTGIDGFKMVHCCGNTDWGLLTETAMDMLSFDAHEYAPNLALYPEEVRAFLARGGMLAWGITPNTSAAGNETVSSLVERLEAGIELLVQKGIHRDDLLQASLISPACGLGTLPAELGERIFELTAGVAAAMQTRYA